MHESLSASNYLFFIKYTPEDEFKPRYFLVQINHDDTEKLKMEHKVTRNYHVIFVARYTDDCHLFDNREK